MPPIDSQSAGNHRLHLRFYLSDRRLPDCYRHSRRYQFHTGTDGQATAGRRDGIGYSKGQDADQAGGRRDMVFARAGETTR